MPEGGGRGGGLGFWGLRFEVGVWGLGLGAARVWLGFWEWERRCKRDILKGGWRVESGEWRVETWSSYTAFDMWYVFLDRTGR